MTLGERRNVMILTFFEFLKMFLSKVLKQFFIVKCFKNRFFIVN